MQTPTPRPTQEDIKHAQELVRATREIYLQFQKDLLKLQFAAKTGIGFGKTFWYVDDGGDPIPSVTDFVEKRDKAILVRRRIGKDGKPSESFAVLIDSWYQYCQPMPAQPPSTQLTL